jgi:hypothetical protein
MLLKSSFCEHNLQRAGVYIFLRKGQYSNQTESSHHCKGKVAQLVEALSYKLEGYGFDPQWCHWNFSLT